MSKYYYFNEQCQGYIVIGKEQKIYIDLGYEDTKFLLNNLVNSKVEHVRKTGETLSTTFTDGITVVFALASFSNKYNPYIEYYTKLRANINEYLDQRRKKSKHLEQERLANYKKRKDAPTKINREKNKSIGPKLVATAAAATLTGAALLSVLFPDARAELLDNIFPDKEDDGIELLDDTPENIENNTNTGTTFSDDTIINTKNNINIGIAPLYKSNQQTSYNKFMENVKNIKPSEEPLEVIPEVTSGAPIVTEDFIVADSYSMEETPIESQYTFEVEFPDKTGNGKYAETERLYGADIKKYSTRFGIPYNVACAYISQERPDNGDPNVCQITGRIKPFTVDIYDENGPTGETEVITIDDTAKTNASESIKAGLAYLRYGIDYNDSFTTGLFGYNQGPYSVNLACDYYGLDINDYKGEENSQKACELIINYFKDTTSPGKVHGDPNYLYNVFGYLPLEDRGSATIECYVNKELRQIAISNQLYYNNGQTRG